MSETVHFRGKLKKIEVEDINTFKKEAVENYFKTVPVPSWYKEEDYKDYFDDYASDKYIINNNNVYEIISQDNINNDGDIYIAKANLDGTIDYEVRYYDGGCGFSEALEEALDRKDQKC